MLSKCQKHPTEEERTQNYLSHNYGNDSVTSQVHFDLWLIISSHSTIIILKVVFFFKSLKYIRSQLFCYALSTFQLFNSFSEV